MSFWFCSHGFHLCAVAFFRCEFKMDEEMRGLESSRNIAVLRKQPFVHIEFLQNEPKLKYRLGAYVWVCLDFVKFLVKWIGFLNTCCSLHAVPLRKNSCQTKILIIPDMISSVVQLYTLFQICMSSHEFHFLYCWCCLAMVVAEYENGWRWIGNGVEI